MEKEKKFKVLKAAVASTSVEAAVAVFQKWTSAVAAEEKISEAQVVLNPIWAVAQKPAAEKTSHNKCKRNTII